MKNLFLLILFIGVFFGAQFVYLENRLQEEQEINFDKVSASIVTIESVNNRGKSFGSGVIISDDGYIISLRSKRRPIGKTTKDNIKQIQKEKREVDLIELNLKENLPGERKISL